MSDDAEAIVRGINRLLSDHAAAPFELLREASVQGRLAELIREELKPDAQCHGVLRSFAKKKWLGLLPRDGEDFRRHYVSRVQLEMKLVTKPEHSRDFPAWCESLTGNGDTFDIVVLKPKTGPDHVDLYCNAGLGPGDVVARVATEDVAAVLEIKAAPALANGERRKFDADFRKLLKLRSDERTRHIQCFLVYLDKSTDVYGDCSASRAFNARRTASYGNPRHEYVPDPTSAIESPVKGESTINVHHLRYDAMCAVSKWKAASRFFKNPS